MAHLQKICAIHRISYIIYHINIYTHISSFLFFHVGGSWHQHITNPHGSNSSVRSAHTLPQRSARQLYRTANSGAILTSPGLYSINNSCSCLATAPCLEQTIPCTTGICRAVRPPWGTRARSGLLSVTPTWELRLWLRTVKSPFAGQNYVTRSMREVWDQNPPMLQLIWQLANHEDPPNCYVGPPFQFLDAMGEEGSLTYTT